MYVVVVLVSFSIICMWYCRTIPFWESFEGGFQDRVRDVEVFCDSRERGGPLGADVRRYDRLDYILLPMPYLPPLFEPVLLY